MTDSAIRDRARTGAALPLAMAFLTVCSLLLMGLFDLAVISREKVRLQIAADMAVLSALNASAESLNAVAVGNRAILACDALSGQANAVVSETTFYRILLEKFSHIAQAIPYGGTYLASMMRRGGRALETLSRRAASLLIPAAEGMKRIVTWEQDAILAFLPARALSAARESVRMNAPASKIHPASQALLIGSHIDRLREIRPLDPSEVRNLIEGTMDRHALSRNWRLKVGGIRFPIRKEGGTAVGERDLTSFDRLKVRVLRPTGWKWKRKISVTSRASDFGFGGCGRILDLTDRKAVFSAVFLLTSPPPSTPFQTSDSLPDLTALSAGRIEYLRDGHPEEAGNLLNPFWRARLIPVAQEETARRLVPRPLLAQVMH